MRQIVDLQQDPSFQSLDVALVSIATDTIPALQAAGREYTVSIPLLSDADGRVSRDYDVMRWATAGGEPGHTFVLVGQDGRIAWIKDYGAPENGGRMYVPVDELVREMTPQLPAS